MKSYLVQALLLGAAVAAPGENARRAACNADNCSRAVFGTTTTGQMLKGSADCSSYLRTTVSPCTVIATTTTTNTATVTATSMPVVTVTSFSTTTSTPVVTVTTSVTATVQNPLKRREADVDLLDKRATSTCPSTTTASVIPATYSACSGAVRFSSACSCRGILPSTIFLATPTTTSTITAPTTITVTETDPITTTTTGTVTVTAATSTSTTTTTVATATASVPQCDNSNPNTLGTGGCSSDCYCDTAYNGGTTNIGVCNDSVACGRRCNSGLDCPMGQSCIMDSSTGPCGGPTCVDTTGCSSTFRPAKRDILSVSAGLETGSMGPAPDAVALSRPL